MNAVRERKDTQVSLADAQAQVLSTSRRLRVYAQGLDFDDLGLSLPTQRGWFGTKDKASVAPADAPANTDVAPDGSYQSGDRQSQVTTLPSTALSDQAAPSGSEVASNAVTTDRQEANFAPNNGFVNQAVATSVKPNPVAPKVSTVVIAAPKPPKVVSSVAKTNAMKVTKVVPNTQKPASKAVVPVKMTLNAPKAAPKVATKANTVKETRINPADSSF